MEPWLAGLLPLHPLLISAVQEHVLRGHVDHQGHGGFGFSLETGRKEAGGSAGSSGANSGHADPGLGSQGGRCMSRGGPGLGSGSTGQCQAGLPEQCRLSPLRPETPPYLLKVAFSQRG